MERMKLTTETAIDIDFKNGEIAGVLYKGKQLNDGSAPMFSVKLRKKTGESRIVSAKECTFVAFENNIAFYTSECFDLKLLVKEKDGALVWKADIKNKTQDLLEWVELMSFTVTGKLQDEPQGQGSIIYPYNEGCRVTNMAYRESMPFRYIEPDYPSKNTFSIFPNMISAQFIAYLLDGVGIYLGMHDSERTTKHVDFCYYDDKIKVFMRAFCDVDYGEDYSMPFDSVFKVFEGDWYQAADIYYHWFSANKPQGLQKIVENVNIPKWYSQSPLVVVYPLRGKHDTDTTPNGLYPYKNALPLLEDIAQKTEGNVMALLMHWEGTAPWAPPYVWPPFGGEEEFSSFVDEAHSKEILVGLYCSGMGWTNRSQVLKEYPDGDDFERLEINEIVCENSNGEVKSTICLAQRDGFDLCPAMERTKRILQTELNKLCASNIDYVQALDQNHGGCSYFCYSDKHGHTPAPGKWQQIETNKLLSGIQTNGVLLGCESAAAEPFLKQLQFSDNRFELNYYIGTPIPLYAYLFHEYVNNFMGNQICAMLEKRENNFTYRLAYSFAAGDMLTVVMNGDGDFQYAWCDYTPPNDKLVNKKSALEFIKTLNTWRRFGGKEFLHYGKMIAPIGVKCSQERFLLEDGKTYFVADAVVCAAYEFADRKAQFIVNYNFYPVEIELEKVCDVYFDSALSHCEKSKKTFTVAPLSVIMVEF